jgi:anti-sigma28 factor (negative regulator of flagellin synthesis)
VSVRRIDPGSLPVSAPFSRGEVRRGQTSRVASFERSGPGSTVGSSGATYGPKGAAQNGGATQTREAEAIMATDARAQKLAAIEKRIQEGAYNTRLSIERVVDRLLDKWNLGSARFGRGSGA